MTEALESAGVARGATVTDVEFDGFIGTGQMSRNARYGLTWDRPDGRPATVVGKFPSHDESTKLSSFGSGAYHHEYAFYADARPDGGDPHAGVLGGPLRCGRAGLRADHGGHGRLGAGRPVQRAAGRRHAAWPSSRPPGCTARAGATRRWPSEPAMQYPGRRPGFGDRPVLADGRRCVHHPPRPRPRRRRPAAHPRLRRSAPGVRAGDRDAGHDRPRRLPPGQLPDRSDAGGRAAGRRRLADRRARARRGRRRLLHRRGVRAGPPAPGRARAARGLPLRADQVRRGVRRRRLLAGLPLGHAARRDHQRAAPR